jgi:hypothetical protein
MDRLGTCIDALRVLARSNDPDRAVLVERYIDAYLTTETVSVWQERSMTSMQSGAKARIGAAYPTSEPFNE